MSQWLEKQIALRDEAWRAVQSSPDYGAFKVLDDTVMRLGGESILQRSATPMVGSAAERVLNSFIRNSVESGKISQADAAVNVLRKHGTPMSVSNLLDGVRAMGIEFSGNDPLASFRSVLSKDERFVSFRNQKGYFWWFASEAKPQGWNEPEEADLLAVSSGSSQNTGQEGGDGDSPATT